MRRLLSKAPDASLNQPTISFTYNTIGQRAAILDQTAYVLSVALRLEEHLQVSGLFLAIQKVSEVIGNAKGI